ncbi:MAG: sigma-70 family RNA polymerase sigma factor [Actinomycetota bacterium]|nr:sigma-70 family RNA polymerase sigma factor [Acidothermales bacterium]MDQ3431297.1 sigma-70 family RNA polymerase sigma factor [Actinomycetota bacterium]
MDEPARVQPAPALALLQLYDDALPHVYGYLRARCGSHPLAEDLTAEAFLAAVVALRRTPPPELSTAWLVGTARHKLVDHWRRSAREEHGLRLVHELAEDHDDPWDAELDLLRAHEVLRTLGTHHRAALTLRYLDDLPVPEVAALLGRSLHATEALLVRARAAFRRTYEGAEDPR